MGETRVESGYGTWLVKTLSGAQTIVTGDLTHLLDEGLVVVVRDGTTLFAVNSGAFESQERLVDEDDE